MSLCSNLHQIKRINKCVYLLFLPAGDHHVSTDLCKPANWPCRQPACLQQWKGSISSPTASSPSHLIHPMGEKSIQALKLAAGRYPFWRACVCLFSKEQSRTERRERERETVVCCVIPWGIIVIGPQGFGEGCCVYANTDGIVTNLQFRLIPDTDCKQHKQRTMVLIDWWTLAMREMTQWHRYHAT